MIQTESFRLGNSRLLKLTWSQLRRLIFKGSLQMSQSGKTCRRRKLRGVAGPVRRPRRFLALNLLVYFTSAFLKLAPWTKYNASLNLGYRC